MKPAPRLAVTLAATLWLLAGSGCQAGEIGGEPAGSRPADSVARAANGPAETVGLAAPAPLGSRTPSLYPIDDGRILMSWQEPIETDDPASASTARGRFALRFAVLEGDAWSAPRTIAEGDDFFVNWADFPMIVENDGVLAAHWLRRNGGRGTAYDIHIARSTDGGESWSEPVVPHGDGTQTEHGFVSLVADPSGGFTAIWLDGRKYATAATEAGREMTLRAARFDAAGMRQAETLLDARICDCCQTSAAWVGETLVAVYRDRSQQEVRDISSVRRTADGWQEPVSVSDDGWQIPGCPVNGPAIAAHGQHAAVAWFTMNGANPEIRLAFTGDAGASFSAPIVLDTTATGIDAASPRDVARLADASDAGQQVPLGRVDVAWIDDDRVAVSWMVARGGDAELVLQAVGRDGRIGARTLVGATGSMRASGFPRLARQGDRLVVAWTDSHGEGGVRTSLVPLDLLR